MKNLFYLLFLLLISFNSAQDISLYDSDGPGKYNITAFDRAGDRSIGGYFDTEYINNINSSSNNFRAHRLIIQLSSQLHSNLLFNSEIEYEYGGYVTNVDDASNVQQGQIKIEQAWFDFKLNDLFTQRTGIVLIPFGRVNVLHDSDARDSTERPLYAKYIVPSTWMDTGFGAHGSFDIEEYEFSYEAYLVNGIADTSDSIDDISVSSGIRSARPNFKSDNNGNKSFVGRFSVSPFINLELATSYYSGAYDDSGDSNLTMLGFDGLYKSGRHEVLFETAQNTLDVSDSQPTNMFGYYIEYHYHTFQTQLKKLFKEFDNPEITLFARYGSINTDVDNDYITNEYVAGFNFRPMETVVYKIEYQVKDYENSDNTGSDKSIIASIAVGF